MPTTLPLIVDIGDATQAGIKQAFNSNLPAIVPQLIRNDYDSVSLRFVQKSSGTSRPWDDVNYNSFPIYAGLGAFDTTPTTGTNTFQAGPITTSTFGNGVTSITVASSAHISNGMLVSGNGIVPGTTITISGNTVTLSNATTSSQTGASLYFYNETAGIATGASAATVSTAVNALSVVSGNGEVTVTNPEPGIYLFVLGTSGATPFYINGNPAALNPVSSLISSEIVVGATGIYSQQVVQIFVSPYALASSWTPFPSASATVASLQSGNSYSYTGTSALNSFSITGLSSVTGLAIGQLVSGTGIQANTVITSVGASSVGISIAPILAVAGTFTFTTPSIQKLTLTPGAYDGTIQLTTSQITTQSITVPLNGVLASSIQSALNALGASYSVTGSPGGPFTISDPTGSNTTITCNVSNMIVPIGVTGTLNLSTYSMLQAFIAAYPSSNLALKFEVQVITSAGQTTPLQLSVNVNKNVINYSKLVPAPAVSYYTTAQALALFDQKNYGSQQLASGVSSAVISGLSFPSVPSLIDVWVQRAGAGPVLGANADQSTFSTGGFTAYLTGQTTDTNSYLCWKAHL